MKKALGLLLLLGFSHLNAQDHIDLVNVYWRLSPSNAIEGISNDQFDFNMFSADIKLPVPLNKKNTLIFGSEYQHSRFTSNSLGISVNSLNFQIGYQRQWNPNFKTLFMFIPKISGSDYRVADASWMQYAGLVLNTKNRTSKFAWKYGAYYNSEFFGPMMVPLFGFDWKINEKHRLKIVAPVDIEYAFMPKAKIKTRMGFRFIGANASYRIQNDQYIDKADNNLWLFGELYFTKNILLHVKAGHSALRKYRIYENDRRMDLKLGPVSLGDDRGPSNPLFRDGWSLEARLTFRLGLSEDKEDIKKE